MRAVVLDELNGEIHISLAAPALWLIEIDGLAIAGRLRDADGARDGGLVNFVAKVFFDLVHHLHGQVEPLREHGEDHALDIQIRVILFADGFQGADELRQALQRIILALNGDQHAVAGTQAVEREQVEAGRAVNEDKVVILLHFRQRLAQAALSAGQVDHFQASARQTGVGTDDIGAELGFADDVFGLRLPDEHFISTQLDTPFGDAVARGGIALWVQIDDQHFFSQCCHAGRKVDGRRCLADAAFLVCNCNDFCHALLIPPGKKICSTWNITRPEPAVFPAAGPLYSLV